MRDALLEALALYEDRAALERATVRAMQRSSDFEWTASAQRYLALYDDVLRPRP